MKVCVVSDCSSCLKPSVKDGGAPAWLQRWTGTDELLTAVAAVGSGCDAPRSYCNNPYDNAPPFHTASFAQRDASGGILNCILNLHYILHSTVTGSLLVVSSHPACHEVVCRMQSPSMCWTPYYRRCARHLGNIWE